MNRRILLLALVGLSAGCGQSTTTSITTPTKQRLPEAPKLDSAAQTAASLAAVELVSQLKAGLATADSLTVDFKKVIGEPLTPSEREKGYSTK